MNLDLVNNTLTTCLMGKDMVNRVDDDDELFNILCHIETNLQAKIERGDFVDLEHLLPKDSGGAGGCMNVNNESKVELVSTGGHTYFKPIKETQINGLRKWEQAFRVYAAMYTHVNPECVTEIWQYMHVINIVASAYQWSTVAYYDLTFRQLMAFKPNRSWAKTYNQGWNLAMKEPLGAGRNVTPAHSDNFRSNFNSGGNSSNGQRRDWWDDCYWKFNCNKCNRNDCHFDHWCTYCGGWNHGFYNCRKCLRKEKGSGSGSAKYSKRSHNPHKRKN